MAHAQKPDFVFRRNGRVHLNRLGRQFSRLLAAELCASAVVMQDTPCSEVPSVKGTGYPLHSPVPPSSPLPCVTVCHHISTGVFCNKHSSNPTLCYVTKTTTLVYSENWIPHELSTFTLHVHESTAYCTLIGRTNTVLYGTGCSSQSATAWAII